MVDVRGDVLRPPHGTTPAAVKANKIQKLSSFKSNENIHKREDGSYYVVSANKASSVTCTSAGGGTNRYFCCTLKCPSAVSDGESQGRLAFVQIQPRPRI